MAEIDAKVNMSLDDIIKMEKKKKTTNPKAKQGGILRGGGPMRGNNTRGNLRGRGNMRGNNARGNNMRARSNSVSRNGQWKKYPQNNTRNNLRGGYIKKRYNNSIKSNLTRSRSNVSLNRMNVNGSPRTTRGGYGPRRGGRGLTRSRSRTNLALNNKPTFVINNKSKGFLKRTTSMPDLRDPSSVYNRLGYQNPAQIAYRNRVKRAKNVLLQRQTKAMRMQNALSLSPVTYKNISPLKQTASPRPFNSGLRSDQILRVQRRSQYEQKLMRMSIARSNPATMSFMNSINAAYNSNHPAMALYDSGAETPVMVPKRQLQRGRSPFRQSLQSLKAATKSANRSASFSRQQQRRSRSRSRSRARNHINKNAIARSDAADLEDRSFSEVMYSLSNNFGVTGRTLNDRFSLF